MEIAKTPPGISASALSRLQAEIGAAKSRNTNHSRGLTLRAAVALVQQLENLTSGAARTRSPPSSTTPSPLLASPSGLKARVPAPPPLYVEPSNKSITLLMKGLIAKVVDLTNENARVGDKLKVAQEGLRSATGQLEALGSQLKAAYERVDTLESAILSLKVPHDAPSPLQSWALQAAEACGSAVQSLPVSPDGAFPPTGQSPGTWDRIGYGFSTDVTVPSLPPSAASTAMDEESQRLRSSDFLSLHSQALSLFGSVPGVLMTPTEVPSSMDGYASSVPDGAVVFIADVEPRLDSDTADSVTGVNAWKDVVSVETGPGHSRNSSGRSINSATAAAFSLMMPTTPVSPSSARPSPIKRHITAREQTLVTHVQSMAKQLTDSTLHLRHERVARKAMSSAYHDLLSSHLRLLSLSAEDNSGGNIGVRLEDTLLDGGEAEDASAIEPESRTREGVAVLSVASELSNEELDAGLPDTTWLLQEAQKAVSLQESAEAAADALDSATGVDSAASAAPVRHVDTGVGSTTSAGGASGGGSGFGSTRSRRQSQPRAAPVRAFDVAASPELLELASAYREFRAVVGADGRPIANRRQSTSLSFSPEAHQGTHHHHTRTRSKVGSSSRSARSGGFTDGESDGDATGIEESDTNQALDVFGLEAAVLQRLIDVSQAAMQLSTDMHKVAQPPGTTTLSSPSGASGSDKGGTDKDLQRALDRFYHLQSSVALPGGSTFDGWPGAPPGISTSSASGDATTKPASSTYALPSDMILLSGRLIALSSAITEYFGSSEELPADADAALAKGKAVMKASCANVFAFLHRLLLRFSADLVLALNVSLRMLGGAAASSSKLFGASTAASFTFATKASRAGAPRVDNSLEGLRRQIAVIAQRTQLEWFCEQLSLAAVPPAWKRGNSSPSGPGGGVADASCAHCGIVFTLFNRKHHCRCCGELSCHACSSQTFPFAKYALRPTARTAYEDGTGASTEEPSPTDASLRVCQSCFGVLKLLP